MSSDTPSKGLLPSDSIKKAFSIDKPRTSQRLANKKAPKEKLSTEPVVGDSVGLSQPLTDLVGSLVGYNTCQKALLFVFFFFNQGRYNLTLG